MKNLTRIIIGAILIACGGISDKRVIKPADKDNVTLKINSFCIFGGADIK